MLMTVPSKTTISATMPTTVRVFHRKGSGEFTTAVLASGVDISGPFREGGCQVRGWKIGRPIVAYKPPRCQLLDTASGTADEGRENGGLTRPEPEETYRRRDFASAVESPALYREGDEIKGQRPGTTRRRRESGGTGHPRRA